VDTGFGAGLLQGGQAVFRHAPAIHGPGETGRDLGGDPLDVTTNAVSGNAG